MVYIPNDGEGIIEKDCTAVRGVHENYGDGMEAISMGHKSIVMGTALLP